MTAEKAAPKGKEVDFTIDEIFFSRTDDRGIIQSGNEVFQRLSEYDWPELIGAPHKVIRHPDMPKAVFHLLWHKIKQGENVIAYVKNRTKTGRPYWVLAYVSPADQGYVSVRVKPVSDIFAKIAPLYEDLLKEEAEIGWSADEHGHSKLLERLAAMGFDSYEAFSGQVAMMEVAERNVQRNRMSNPIFVNLVSVSETVKDLSGKVAALADIFQRIRTTPVNLGIMANRIERSGGPISAISGIYSSMSTEIGDWLDGFLESSEQAFKRMQEEAVACLSVIAAAETSIEMLTAFEREKTGDQGFNHYDEIVRLKKKARVDARKARNTVSAIRQEASEIQNAVHVLKRHVMSLSSTRVLCEIESAKLPQRSESLEGVVAQLASFQEEIEDLHKDIEGATQSIISSLASEALTTTDEAQKPAEAA